MSKQHNNFRTTIREETRKIQEAEKGRIKACPSVGQQWRAGQGGRRRAASCHRWCGHSSPGSPVAGRRGSSGQLRRTAQAQRLWRLGAGSRAGVGGAASCGGLLRWLDAADGMGAAASGGQVADRHKQKQKNGQSPLQSRGLRKLDEGEVVITYFRI